MAAKMESPSSIAPKSRKPLTKNRTPQQVTIRLDALIEKVHKIQAPYMHGENPVDIMLVRPPTPHSNQIPLTKPTPPDLPRPPPPRIRKTLAQLPHADPTINDDGPRRHRHLKVSIAKIPIQSRLRVTDPIPSYQHHSINEPAFLLGMGLPG